MAKKKTEDPIEGEVTQDQVAEEAPIEVAAAEVSAETVETVIAEVAAEEVVAPEPEKAAEKVSEKEEEAKAEKPLQIGLDGNPILPAEEHVKNWGKMTTVPYGQESAAPESE